MNWFLLVMSKDGRTVIGCCIGGNARVLDVENVTAVGEVSALHARLASFQ